MDKEFIRNIDDNVLAKYFAGELPLDKEKLVLEWTKLNEENQSLFNKSKSIWDGLNNFSFNQESINPDVNVAWKNLKTRINTQTPAPKLEVIKTPRSEIKEVGSSNFPWMKIAAGIILLVGFYGVFNWITKGESNVNILAKDVMPLTLPDGSVITINKNSSIEYSKEFEQERRIYLNGEAFFEVKRDINRPFVVEIGIAEVIVLGTSFNIKGYDESENIEVSVSTGKVKFRNLKNNSSINLIAKENGVLNKKSQELLKNTKEIQTNTFWKDKTLIFKKTELAKVVDVLKSVYHQEIRLKNEMLKDCKLTAKFKDKSLKEIIEIIAITFNLTVSEENTVIELNGKDCE